MTPAQRVLAALSGRIVSPLPVLIPYQGILRRDHWEEITDQPWWVMLGYDLEALADVIQAEAALTGADVVAVGPVPSRAWRDRHRLIVRDGQPWLLDLDTGTEQALERPRDTTRAAGRPAEPLRDIAEIDRRWPLHTADQMLADGSLDLAARLVERLAQRYALMGSIGLPLWVSLLCLGFERGLMAVYDEPDLLAALCQRWLAQDLEHLTALARVGVPVVWMEDCWTSRDLLSLEHFRRFCQPANERIIAHAHSLGLRVIHYFCGDVEDRLAWLVAAGPDAIGLEETKKHFDLDLARLAPRVPASVCLLGNVDAIHVLERGTPAQLQAEVRRQADAGRARGPFILSLGSPVTPGTPIRRVREFTDIGHAV